MMRKKLMYISSTIIENLQFFCCNKVISVTLFNMFVNTNFVTILKVKIYPISQDLFIYYYVCCTYI